jgi:hypothetical protein
MTTLAPALHQKVLAFYERIKQPLYSQSTKEKQ